MIPTPRTDKKAFECIKHLYIEDITKEEAIQAISEILDFTRLMECENQSLISEVKRYKKMIEELCKNENEDIQNDIRWCGDLFAQHLSAIERMYRTK